ncbi:TPA: hypothetical protein N0F65_000525 [Lagenidium giganteum]|uniref:RRM domain-containing protein n=1 Tax=Lagenidium giganteum TaxID=4803 RepID=A0AAV2Z3Z0_9STRA|nr:TPA: hypothetical protein N0F65_000525 [Lagenidium giganteum]
MTAASTSNNDVSGKRAVYLTGFGKFADILENPTTEIARTVANDANITHSTVLEVSAEGSLEMLAPLRKMAEEAGKPCVFLHLGVNAQSETFALERHGYNLADFRVPDERGWVAQGEIICKDEGDSLTTALPLEELLGKLITESPAVISTDPGRYICNYVYFDSLKWANEQLKAGKPQHHALFLHVPQFSVIPFEAQVAFCADQASVPVVSCATAGNALKEAIKRQVEFYFSRTNLANDAYLVSHMNSQMYVPVEVIVNFSKIKQLTEDTQLLIESIRDSTVCSLNETNDAIKPNIKSERNTIILREIPSATKPEDVEAIFEGCGKVTSVRSDLGDTWFATMESEEEAVKTLLALRNKTFNNAPIKARLKSENLLKSFFPTQPAAAENAAAALSTPYGGRAYYNAAPMGGYYDAQNSYGMQYNAGPRGHYNGAENNRYAMNQRGGRGPNAGRFHHGHGGRGPHPHSNQQPQAQQQAQPQSGKENRNKSGSFEQPRASGKKSKKQAKQQQQGQQQAHQTPASGKKAAAAGDRQPILSAANFPPLPTTDKADEPIKHAYSHEDIMEIVKNMDENDCKLPAGKMDFDAHPAALTPDAHPDLLRNQRTYSIEQAREAMRQGRPIRSDSVGSIDYESMMYGEDYTKEAREQRKQKAEAAPASGDAKAKDAAPAKADSPAKDAAAAPKIVGYAAAVINGTPAPAALVEGVATKKKVTPKAKTPKGKDEKKAVKKTKDAKDAAEPKPVDDLPKSGAWGGRNFLDVVKSESQVPPPAPAAASAAPTTPSGSKKADAKPKDKKERRVEAPKEDK